MDVMNLGTRSVVSSLRDPRFRKLTWVALRLTHPTVRLMNVMDIGIRSVVSSLRDLRFRKLTWVALRLTHATGSPNFWSSQSTGFVRFAEFSFHQPLTL